MRKRIIGMAMVAALASFAFAMPAGAAGESRRGGVDVTPAEFNVQADKVREAFENGGYPKVSESDRRIVEDYFTIISRILTKRGSSQAMTSQEKLDVFNMQERINGILAGGADYQVCSVDKITGSHFKKKECVSAKQKEDLRREEHDTLTRLYLRRNISAPGA